MFLYNLTTLFVKASILAFYTRFSIDIAFLVFTYITLFVVISYSIVNIVGSWALNCGASNPSACHKNFIIFIVTSALNVATDFIILLMPFWILHPMKISRRRRIAIALVLMAGGLYVLA